MKNLSTLLGVFAVLSVFPKIAAGQAWVVHFADSSLSLGDGGFVMPAIGGGVRLVANDTSVPIQNRFFNFGKNGGYLNTTAINLPGPFAVPRCVLADNAGATYWFNGIDLKKHSADNQLAWTYPGLLSTSGSSIVGTSNGNCFVVYHEWFAGPQVIDEIDSAGQLVNTFNFNTGSAEFRVLPGHDGSIIFEESSSTNTVHWVKMNQNNQVVWEKDLKSNEFMVSGALLDGSAYYIDWLHQLTKLNPAGGIEWAVSITDYVPFNSGYAYYWKAIPHSDGNVVLEAVLDNSTNFGKTPYLVKIDPANGAAIWATSHQTGLFDWSENKPLLEMPDGGVVTFVELNKGNKPDYFIIRTDANGNTFPYTITGNLYFDTNFDCAPQPNEPPLPAISVIAKSGAETFSSTTDAAGHFTINTASGDYALSFGQLGQYWNTCDPGTISLDNSNDTAHLEIGAKPTILCPALAVSLGSPVFRRCFDNNYLTVAYQNIGTVAAQNSYVDITLDPKLIYQSSTVPLLSQNGQVFRFGLGEIGIGAGGSFKIFLKVDCDATLGELLCASGHIYPDTSCLPTAAAVFENPFCLHVVASFDPNDKTAFVYGRPEAAKIQPDSSLEYLIRFQNTGTDTAFNIVVVDTLTALLDAASVLPGAASHPYSFELKDGRILRFSFKNILLSDSTMDEVGSHGFVKFSVRQAAGNPLGATIQNRAAIYFDYNLPVMTNQTALVVTKQVRTNEPKSAREAKIWPIPASDRVEILLENAAAGPIFWKMMDATGRVVQIGEEAGNSFGIERRGLPGGAYFLLFLDKKGVSTAGKVVFD